MIETCIATLCWALAQLPQEKPHTVRKLAGSMAFTEGPVWLPEEDKLVFSDIPASVLMQWSESDGLAVFRESENANGNVLDPDGRLVSCQHGARNIVRAEEDGSLTVLAERFEGKRFNSPNDAVFSSDGTLWFTDPPWGLEEQRKGRELAGHWVFRVAPQTGTVTAAIRDLAMPNGVALSPDETVLYVADTGGHPSHPDPARHELPPTLSAYAIGDDGSLSAEPTWRVETLCDGMCVDENGNVYATGRGAVTIWTPAGQQAGAIPVPEQPANVCFGGADFRTLFITARTSLYAVDLDVRGHRLRRAPSAEQTRETWNEIFVEARDSDVEWKPNAFLARVVSGREPGRALDIGMGQGRNALFLAQAGWQVTGFDLADEAVRQARESAATAGIELDARVADVSEFDYGEERWDLVVAMYMHGLILPRAGEIVASIAPGGLLVIEGFHRDLGLESVEGGRFGYLTNQLLRTFDDLRIVHYEDRTDAADWAGLRPGEKPIVRLVARKPSAAEARKEGNR